MPAFELAFEIDRGFGLELPSDLDESGVAGAAFEPSGEALGVELDELFELYARGAILPRISARYPLERGGQAIAELGARRALGKLVVLNDA